MWRLGSWVASVRALTSCVLLANGETAFGALTAKEAVQTTEATLSSGGNPGLSRLQTNSLETANGLRSFLASGQIRELPVGGRTLIIRHEAIPNFMPKMTMEFNVRRTNELRGLRLGDTVTFRVVANEEESWIEDIERAAGVVTPTPADPPSSSAHRGAPLKPGDLLPDAELLTENGHTIKLSAFRGSCVAFTFIFTRCPLPNFCPRMNLHLSRAREWLQRQGGGATNWQFLSISFDPEFDRPGVLTRYAESYRGPNADRWLFAAASTNALAALAPRLDFRFANDRGGFLHNLRTVVLDPEGRIFRQFDGNNWKAEELAQAMLEAILAERRAHR